MMSIKIPTNEGHSLRRKNTYFQLFSFHKCVIFSYGPSLFADKKDGKKWFKLGIKLIF